MLDLCSHVSAKEPYISAKEPYISTKEPYMRRSFLEKLGSLVCGGYD